MNQEILPLKKWRSNLSAALAYRDLFLVFFDKLKIGANRGSNSSFHAIAMALIVFFASGSAFGTINTRVGTPANKNAPGPGLPLLPGTATRGTGLAFTSGPSQGVAVWQQYNAQQPQYKVYNGLLNTYGPELNAPSVNSDTPGVLMSASSPTDHTTGHFLKS